MGNTSTSVFPGRKVLSVVFVTIVFAVFVQIYLFLANWVVAGHPFLRPNINFDVTNVVILICASPVIETVVMFLIFWLVGKAKIPVIIFIAANALIAVLFHEGLGKLPSTIGFVLISMFIIENEKSLSSSQNFGPRPYCMLFITLSVCSLPIQFIFSCLKWQKPSF